MQFIILDRDGVINYDSEEYIKSPDEWSAIPGSLEAIAQLNRAGFHVVVATNQSGVARGFYDLATLDLIHEKFTKELAAVGGYVDEIFFCPHHPEEGCNCRKPKTGMLLQFQKKYGANFPDVFYIGDSIVDIKAALTVGCKPILVLTGNGRRTLEKNPDLKVEIYEDLAEAARAIISGSNTK